MRFWPDWSRRGHLLRRRTPDPWQSHCWCVRFIEAAPQPCVLASIMWDVSCLSHFKPIIPVCSTQWLFWAATTIIIQFNFLFFCRFQGESREARVSHIAYVLSWAQGALLTAPLGICCPWPAYICILMHISCWDVNFRPSVIDGFHTSAESPLFPSPCRLLVYLCGLGVFQSTIVLLWRNYNRLKEREKREREKGGEEGRG